MRRFLILLIVLAGGAAALWHFEGERRSALGRQSQLTEAELEGVTERKPRPDRPGVSAVTPEEASSGDAEGADTPSEELRVHDGERAVFRGEGKLTRPPLQAGETLLELFIGDQVPLDDIGLSYDFMDVAADWYIVPVFDGAQPPLDGGGSAELSSTVKATRMRVEQSKLGLGTKFFDDNVAADFFGVVARIFRGTAFAPLKLEAPRLTGDFAVERLQSVGDDRVDFKSRNMRGYGKGLDAQVQIGSLAFLRGADVQIDIGEGRVLRVSTPSGGPLRLDEQLDEEEGVPVVPDPNAPREVRVYAEQGVHVELKVDDGSRPSDPDLEADEDEESSTGGGLAQKSGMAVHQPLVIDAANMEVLLTVYPAAGPDGDELPVIEIVRASGSVTIRHGRDVYRGDTARVTFEDGEATRIVIEKNPTLTYILRDEDGQEVELKMTGKGPITGHIAGGTPENPELRFVFTGPGRIEASGRGGVVTFENEARGNGARDRSEATVLLAGDVRVETPRGTMTSSAVIATYEAGQALRVATDGSTLIIGRDPETGDQYHVRADGGMTAHLKGESWFVDRAKDVYAESFSDEPHRVRAGMLTDVDVSAGTFAATDSILYESLWGRAVANKALVRTAETVTLIGSPEEPVQLDLVSGSEGMLVENADSNAVRSGWINASEIRFDATEVIAQGNVAAQVETFEGVWGFDAHELSVRREVTGKSFVLDGDAPGPSLGQFTPEQREDLFVTARFVGEARYDTDMGNTVVAADRVEVEVGAAASVDPAPDDSMREGDAKRPVVDPTRSAILRAFGRVSVDMESYGPTPDERGLPTVQQTWHLAAASAVFEREPGGVDPDEKVPFILVAEEVTECRFAGLGRLVELTADLVTVEGAFGPLDEGAAAEEIDLTGSKIVALGSVDMLFRSAADQPAMSGRCGRLVLEDGVRGRMEPERLWRVITTGVVPGTELKYRIESNLVTFTRDEVTADSKDGTKVKIELDTAVRVSAIGSGVDEVLTDRLVANEKVVSLSGASTLTGVDANGRRTSTKFDGLTVATKDLELMEKSKETIGPFDPVPQASVPASGGVPEGDAEDDEEDDVTQSGAFESEVEGFYKIVGSKGAFDGSTGNWVVQDAVAELYESGITLDAEWISFNLSTRTLGAGRGAVRGGGVSPWTLQFAGIETHPFGDELMFAITAPRVTYGDDSARADYLSFWVDRGRWEALGGDFDGAKKSPDAGEEDIEIEKKPNFLAEILFELQDREYGGYLRALYMEGGVEVIRGDRRAARGSKLYIDLPKAVAWLEDAELVYPLMSRGKEVPLRVRTKRLGTDEEGRLTAENATLTTCDHDVPHFVVLTRKFALEPRPDGRWRFGASGNKLKFTGGLSLPLPSIGNLVLDEEFGIEGFENEAGEVTPLRDIGIARTARFGTVLGAAFRYDVGSVGNWLAERIGMDPTKLRGKWETEAQFLSGRGPLLGLGLQLRERKPGDDPDEDFRLDAFLGGIVDDGEDRGSVRVQESEREDLRLTGYLRARYPVVRGEWFDFAVASQTDAAVQSEFYEGDFLRFEQRDTFARWRKSYGADYLSAGVQKRINTFRSQKEELPSFAAYRGEREVGTFTGVPILWGGSFDVGYFRRLEGDQGQDLFSDLPGGAQAGLGDQETGRADARQRLSLPIQTRLAGIKATPFAEARGTVWTRALDNAEEDPRRGALRSGLELSTTLHKVTDNGYLHALAPRLSYSTDIASEQSGGDLIPLDRTELPIDGTHYEAGLRSLWQRPGTFENLDLDVSAIFMEDRDNGVADASQLATLAQYVTRYGDGVGQVGVRHDARYSLESSETTYSRSALAIRPNDALLVEFRYSQARAIDQSELYETGGILGRWRIDPKWELETRYIHDLKNDQQLLTELTVRRYAHDFVFDITFQERSGEGGTNISFNLVPLLGWTAARFGMLDR
ncbi:MAG: hypothetical protein ACJA2W_000563 [Planctomycetota bacterium]|jgi:hypothetical protein